MSTAVSSQERQRELTYNVYLSSLDKSELEVYLKANYPDGDTQESLELFCHDLFILGAIDADNIATTILDLLGEL